MTLEKFNKIFICGISGAGKTTLARNISEFFGHSPVYMDEHFWQENWQQVPIDECYHSIDKAIEVDSWVLEGAVGKIISRYAPQADVVIWLNFSRYLAVFRVLKRTLLHYNGKARSEMPDGCVEKFDLSFIKWIWDYPNRNERIRSFFLEKNINFIEVGNKKELKKLLGDKKIVL